MQFLQWFLHFWQRNIRWKVRETTICCHNNRIVFRHKFCISQTWCIEWTLSCSKLFREHTRHGKTFDISTNCITRIVKILDIRNRHFVRTVSHKAFEISPVARFSRTNRTNCIVIYISWRTQICELNAIGCYCIIVNISFLKTFRVHVIDMWKFRFPLMFNSHHTICRIGWFGSC